jgi:hypothetical protein
MEDAVNAPLPHEPVSFSWGNSGVRHSWAVWSWEHVVSLTHNDKCFAHIRLANGQRVTVKPKVQP